MLRKLRSAGYNIHNNIDDGGIINLIVENSGNDHNIATVLAEMISKRNQDANADYFNTGGTDVISSVANLIGGIFQNSAAKKLSESEVEAQKYALAQQVIAMRSQPNTDPNVKYVWIFTSVVVVSLAIIIGMAYSRKVKTTQTT